MSETAYRLKTISVVNKIKHCHHLWNTLSLLKTNQAETQWYILLIGWVQRVYEQVPAFSNVCQKTKGFIHTAIKGNIGGNLWFVHNYQFYTQKAQN